MIYEDFLCPVCGQLETDGAATRSTAAVEAGDVTRGVPPDHLPGAGIERLLSRTPPTPFAVVLDAAGPEVAKAFHDRSTPTSPPRTASEFPDND